MNKTDKDSYLKQLAIRFCLSQGHLACPEVVVLSPSELTETPEPLSDLDVVGLETMSDGKLRRTLFDCKSGKVSAINRAFWAAGMCTLASLDNAVIILGKSASENHRLAALQLKVDIHSEQTFSELAKITAPDFDRDLTYQSSVKRWQSRATHFRKWTWIDPIEAILQNQAPISSEPAKVFRKLVAEVQAQRGEFDPSKREHISLFYAIIVAMLTLWSPMAQDIRRVFRSDMNQQEFLLKLRFYLWGGRESYDIRKNLSSKFKENNIEPELPEWVRLQKFTSSAISSPRSIIPSANIAQDLSLRSVTTEEITKDGVVRNAIETDDRAAQLILSSADYLVSACRLPREFYDLTSNEISNIGR